MDIFKIIDDIKNFIIGFVAGIKKFIGGFKTEVELLPAPTTEAADAE